MKSAVFRWAWAVIPWLAATSFQATVKKVSYDLDIAPVLKSKCISCHGPNAQSGGLRLDSAQGIRSGGVSGPLFGPSRSSGSLLLKRLLEDGAKPRMPMGFAPLSPQTISKFQQWIEEGADFGSIESSKHWAYSPPRRPHLPKVIRQGWVRNPIDVFVLSRLEGVGLKPSIEASRETLARRVALDLTGLPPTVVELDRYLGNKAPGAYERYVDRLLASPHYGEKMARAWLDLARYADTNGYEKDLPRQMWLWRDWVIGAFNRNIPFDQFTVEQLAGDLLPKPNQDQLIATGFHRNSMLNDEGGIDAEEFRTTAVMDRVDATATTWMGSTLACAQCHDHKYDPFSQKDYYSFLSYFNQSADNGRDMSPLLKVPSAEQARQINALEGQIAEVSKKISDATTPALAGMPAWEDQVQNGWTTPKPLGKASAATLQFLADNSILATGTDPAHDLYTITLATTMPDIAGLRLEVVPDPSLPTGSSGRNANGSFVLKMVTASLVNPAGGPMPISFVSALADFTQAGHDPVNLIEGKGAGWAVAAFMPEHRVTHSVVFSFAKPVTPSAQNYLVVMLDHGSGFEHHNLGRFRLSVTASPDLAKQSPPDPTIRAILAKNKSHRTVLESKFLRDFYLRNAPVLRELQTSLEGLKKRRTELEAQAPTTMIMSELPKPRPNRVLKRGDFRTPGEVVIAGVPKALGGYSVLSNRLGLAKWLVSPKNPLTARVQVNRLWEQCFGRGLVATPEDFGTQGDRPSHPELLDWLASEFMARTWDVKAMLKLIVTSATYRQASSHKSYQSDPENILLARGPRFRVEAETVRDIALTASGRLTRTIGGPSVMPPQPPGIWENSFTFYDTTDRWVDATGPNRYRRGLYTYWRRTAPFPMAMTFDLKSRDMCVSRRSRTNTPLQALNTLNDPLFLECAGALGVKLSSLANDDLAIQYGFRSCTSRKPKSAEVSSLKNLLKSARLRFGRSDGQAEALLRASGIRERAELTTTNAAWTVVANALLNLDETITKG